MRTSTLALVFAISIAIAAACAGRQQTGEKITRDEITALWTQIRDWRREARLPVEPRREDVIAMSKTTVKAAEAVCPVGHTIPDSCGDVCSLADAICDNAESICGIADELNDPWAREKCDSAKASCREARQRCCRCDEDAPDDASGDASATSSEP